MSSRAARCSGSTARSSAAPSAANAIARGDVDRSVGGALELDDGRPGEPMLTSLWAAAVPSPQMHLPQQSSSGRLVSPTAAAVHPVAAGTAVCLRLVQEPQRNPGETVHSRSGVGLSGGDNKDPGHVVGAVAVLGPGFGETGVLEGAATVRHPQQMVEYRGRRGGGHTNAGRSARSRLRQTQIRARHDRPRHLWRQSAGLGRHGAGQAWLRQDPAQR